MFSAQAARAARKIRWFLFAAMLAPVLFTVSARAVSIDLSGQVIKPGGSIGGVSTTAVTPALLYDVGFTGTGTATGSFAYITGTNTLASVLMTMGIEPQPLVSITGKLPVTFCNETMVNYLENVPLTSSTSGNVIISAHVVFAIDKKGFVHASASQFTFNARGTNNKKVPITGAFTIAAGGAFTVAPSVAQSGTAAPNIVFPLGHFEWDEAIVNMLPGTSRTLFFILQNDGPFTDNYTLQGYAPNPLPPPPAAGKPTPKPYFTAAIYDGTNNITNSVYTIRPGGYEIPGPGYQINNFPSGGQKLIKAIVHVAPGTPTVNRIGPGQVGFILESATTPSNSATGTIEINTR
jgi:hypothetical protein